MKTFKKIARIAYFFLRLEVLFAVLFIKEILNSKPGPPPEVPDKIENFEDLHWLFFSNFANRWIIKMAFNEAAYLFRVVRENKPAYLLETGTCQGGTAMLLATAKSKEAKLVSLDLKNKRNETIKKLLDENTSLIIEDSRKFIPSQKIDFLLIDGDHSFEGVKADFEHYFPYLNEGADVLFHDAVGSGKYMLFASGVNAFVKQLEKRPELKFVKDMESIRHFKKYG